MQGIKNLNSNDNVESPPPANTCPQCGELHAVENTTARHQPHASKKEAFETLEENASRSCKLSESQANVQPVKQSKDDSCPPMVSGNFSSTVKGGADGYTTPYRKENNNPNSLLTNVTEKTKGATQYIANGAKQIVNEVKEDSLKVKEGAQTTMQEWKEGTQHLAHQMVEGAKQAAHVVAEQTINVAEGAKNAATYISTGAINAAHTTKEGAATAAELVAEQTKNALNSLVEGTKSVAGDVLETTKQVAQKTADVAEKLQSKL